MVEIILKMLSFVFHIHIHYVHCGLTGTSRQMWYHKIYVRGYDVVSIMMIWLYSAVSMSPHEVIMLGGHATIFTLTAFSEVSFQIKLSKICIFLNKSNCNIPIGWKISFMLQMKTSSKLSLFYYTGWILTMKQHLRCYFIMNNIQQ